MYSRSRAQNISLFGVPHTTLCAMSDRFFTQANSMNRSLLYPAPLQSRSPADSVPYLSARTLGITVYNVDVPIPHVVQVRQPEVPLSFTPSLWLIRIRALRTSLLGGELKSHRPKIPSCSISGEELRFQHEPHPRASMAHDQGAAHVDGGPSRPPLITPRLYILVIRQPQAQAE